MKSFQDEIKERVLVNLAEQPLTSMGLAERLNASYPTIRRVIIELQDEGEIVRYDNKARNARYTLNPNKGPKTRVPKVSTGTTGAVIKMTELNHPDLLVPEITRAGHDIMRAWTQIAHQAEALNEGIASATVGRVLNRQRVKLYAARNRLENINFLITQLVDNDNLWDPEYISKMPEDSDWPEFTKHLQKMFLYYSEGEGKDL